MASVWVVEQGSYSDYHVVGVFSSQANAELVRASLKGDSYDEPTVAEWPLDPAIDALRQGHRPYNVTMARDGAVERLERTDPSGYDLGGKVWLWARTKAPAYSGTQTHDVLVVTAWATDDAHAIKIANEHRTRMIANGEWR